MKTTTRLALIASWFMMALPVSAQDVRITTFKSDSTFSLNGQTFVIARNQDTNAVIDGDYARTSRACPPNCIQPMIAAPGVATFAELEVIGFLETNVTDGTGLLLDVRAPEVFAFGSIPGAVNVPFLTLGSENRYRDDILRALGAVDGANGRLDFSDARSLAVFSGGAWSNDATSAIDHLLAAGYPPEKLFYYRGGMQAWVHVGLTVQYTQNPG